MYKLLYSEIAKKQLAKLDKQISRMIVSWLTKNIDNCDNPYQHGKFFKGNLRGFFRYRVGDYRVICTIDDGKMIVIAITLGHRKNNYL